MKTKAVTGIMLTLLFMGILSFTFDIQQVEASGTITIKADGSIEGTTDISSADNITYTFTDNIYDEIVVESDNIVVDGVGHTLQGTGSGTGMNLTGRSNVTIMNVEIEAFDYGIWLQSSSNTSICENGITNNGDGIIVVYTSNNNSISRNNITANTWDGILLYNSSSNTICGNNIMRNNQCAINLVRSHANIILGNNIRNNEEGVNIWVHSSNNTFCHNNFTYNTVQATVSSGCPNIWNESYSSGGNHWSDHNPTDLHSGPYQNETGSDGIGDTPYIIDGNNTDRYPLIYPYGYVPSPDVNGDGIVNIQDVLIAALAFGSQPGDAKWNPIADLDGNGIINILDLVIIGVNFGKKA